MAKYDIRLSKDGIEAGMLNKNGQWHSGSDVTEKAFAVVRDHLIRLSKQENKDVNYYWNYPNGKSIILQLKVVDTDEIKKGE